MTNEELMQENAALWEQIRELLEDNRELHRQLDEIYFDDITAGQITDADWIEEIDRIT